MESMEELGLIRHCIRPHLIICLFVYGTVTEQKNSCYVSDLISGLKIEAFPFNWVSVTATGGIFNIHSFLPQT